MKNALRMVGLGSLGRDGKPETWSAAADEARHRSEEMLPRFHLRERFCRAFNDLTDNLFRLNGSVVCCGQRDIIRQPNFQVKPELDVFRKELLLQGRSHETLN